MTKNLPNDLLLIIFNELDSSDLFNCQQVCRSWYCVARTLILKYISINGAGGLKQFLAVFDFEHNQAYLNTLKYIRLPLNDSSSIAFDEELLEKLLFRFPKLENVHCDCGDLIAHFNDDLCRTFLSRCPNLDNFTVEEDHANLQFFDSLLNVRLLLTSIDLPRHSVYKAAGPAEFISQFPRLRKICWEDSTVRRLDQFLPIFEQLSNVNDLFLGLEEDTEENFGEKYFSRQSKQVQDQVIQRLSNITELYLEVADDTGNAIQFINEYFTGIETLYVDICLYASSPGAKQDQFYRNTFSLIQKIRNSSSIEFSNMHIDSLVRNFTPLVQTMFPKAPAASTFSRIVKIKVHDENQQVRDSILNLLTSGAPLDEVDVFSFRFHRKDHNAIPAITLHDYLQILASLPSLKQVTLDVPASFVDEDTEAYSGPVLSQVEEAMLWAACEGAIQSLLTSCYFAFPNIKYLHIYNYGGTWNSITSELRFCLDDYSLERLTLHTNPALLLMTYYVRRRLPFFVLEVEIRDLGKRVMYKISDLLLYCEKVQSCELENWVRGKDYCCISIAVKSLKRLELLLLDVGKRDGQRSCVIMPHDNE